MSNDKKSKLNASYEELLKNASVYTQSGEEKQIDNADSTLRSMAADARRGQFNFINVAVILMFVLILGVSFALLRNSSDPDEETVKPTIMGIYDGSYTSYLSKSYENALPGKSLLARINGFFSHIYGAKSLNTHQNFIPPVDENGNVINTLTAVTTTTTTTTIFTGKTTNTTIKINKDDIYIGPQSNIITTTTTKKTTEKTTEPTTEPTTEKTTTTTTEPEETQTTTTVKIDLEDIVFEENENGALLSEFVIEPEFDVTDIDKLLLSYRFFGETRSYFIRPYIEYNGRNIGKNVNPTDSKTEFDVSNIEGNIKIAIRFIPRANSEIKNGDSVNVKLSYGLGYISKDGSEVGELPEEQAQAEE